MRLIINIPNEVYEDIRDNYEGNEVVYTGVKYGEPVPAGYKLVKCPDYDCCCIVDYPNKNHCRKNGHWKCIDRFEYWGKTKFGKTACIRKEVKRND